MGQLPAISRIGSRLPLSHTFHEHSRVARPPDSLLPSDATRAAIDQFLWYHPRKQNGHTRHLVATKVGAVVFATRGRKRRGMWVRNGADCSRLPLVRPSRPVLRAPPGARPRRATRRRVSRPGRTGRTLCRAVAATTVRHASSRIRRRAATLVGLIRPRTSWSHTTASLDAVATDPVSNTITIPGTTPTVVGSALSTGSYCLFVVLQHLGHGCLHGPAGFLALLAQLTTQGQGGCPG